MTVLVTGAAGGQQGKTGRRVTELLRARDIPVRAMVRTDDDRAEYLRGLGAEVVVGDFLDHGSLRRAVDGVSTVYFAYPVQEGLLEATVNMAVAARDAGVTRLVDMVMLVSTPDAPTPRMRENYLSEQVFEWAGVGAAHVRAAVFFENVRSLANAGRLVEENPGLLQLRMLQQLGGSTGNTVVLSMPDGHGGTSPAGANGPAATAEASRRARAQALDPEAGDR